MPRTSLLSGIRPVEGERSPIMPGFAGSMNDDHIAALLSYLRARFSDRRPGPALRRPLPTQDARRRCACRYCLRRTGAPLDPTQRDKP